jgi:hypothetical protein
MCVNLVDYRVSRGHLEGREKPSDDFLRGPMIAMLYLLTGSLFYWLAYKRAPIQEEVFATHPARGSAEIIELFSEQEEIRRAA